VGAVAGVAVGSEVLAGGSTGAPSRPGGAPAHPVKIAPRRRTATAARPPKMRALPLIGAI